MLYSIEKPINNSFISQAIKRPNKWIVHLKKFQHFTTWLALDFVLLKNPLDESFNRT